MGARLDFLTFKNLLKKKVDADNSALGVLEEIVKKMRIGSEDGFNELVEKDCQVVEQDISLLKDELLFHEYQFIEGRKTLGAVERKSHKKVAQSSHINTNENENTGEKAEKSLKEGKKASKNEKPRDLSRLHIQVGQILEVEKHPSADKLYVEKVFFGEGKHLKIVSGLVQHIPIEQMQNRRALFVTNLKPVKMRGIASEGMILCASTPDKVEILEVPEKCSVGETVIVEGCFSTPDHVLNPKEKVLESVLPLLKTNSLGEATYDNKPLTTATSNFTVRFSSKSLTDAPVK